MRFWVVHHVLNGWFYLNFHISTHLIAKAVWTVPVFLGIKNFQHRD